MHDTTANNGWPMALGLAVLMAATRSRHFASMTHLPDASWAVFFLAGFYLRRVWAFPALLGVAGASDYTAIAWFGVSDFCVSPAYAFLLPAYGALWLAGRWYARQHQLRFASLPRLALALVTGAAACELLSSGGFYFFSGRFTETSFIEFGARLAKYFPQGLEAMIGYVAAAVLVHLGVALAVQPAARGAHRAH
ncbi:hypothetical protein [Candidatus Methylocalor cossyra]|uniref:Cobalamin ABC transporter n=1 Tax=Candidatus Methylocalor cossyra TaxID=3108543 RepID=A0ABM9NGW8_9GAMM